jgi:hypothetical protein
MKNPASMASCALVVCALAAPVFADSGASSNGSFQFAIAGASGSIQFDAREHATGARGTITFTSTQAVSNEDVDGDGSGASDLAGVSMEVAVDCVRVNGNRASMSGVISSASAPGYTGLRAILAVEDGGEGSKGGPDRFTWGAYRARQSQTWTPEDAEVPGDNGAMFTWFASDAERIDDVPVPWNYKTGKSGLVDCKSFALGAYAFEDLPHGAGNIQVKP